jgi:hypothetical protein
VPWGFGHPCRYVPHPPHSSHPHPLTPPLPPSPLLSQWWRRRGAQQTAAQLAFGVNMTVIALGLPLAWNWTVKGKWEAAAKTKEGRVDDATREAERLLVELLVDERRKAQGKEPWVWNDSQAGSAASASATAAAPRLDSASAHKERVALWAQVEELNRLHVQRQAEAAQERRKRREEEEKEGAAAGAPQAAGGLPSEIEALLARAEAAEAGKR